MAKQFNRRSIRRLGLVGAMEEFEGTSPDVIVPDDDFEQPEELMEANDEVADVSDALEEMEDELDDGIADAEVIEKVGDTYEKYADQGTGIDDTAAEIGQITVEHMCARLGIEMVTVRLPATESFKDVNFRVKQTRMAAEAIQETAGRAWDAFAGVIKKTHEQVMEFVKKATDANHRNVEWAKKLKTNIGSLQGEPKAPTMDVGSLAGADYFGSAGKLDASAVKNGLAQHSKLTVETAGEFTKILEDILTKSVSYIETMSNNPQKAEDIQKFIDDIGTEIATGANAIKGSKTEDGKTVIGPFGSGESIIVSVEGTKVKIDWHTEESHEVTEASVLSPADMGQICDLVIKLGGENAALKMIAKESQDLLNKGSKAISNVSGILKSEQAATPEMKGVLSALRKLMVSLFSGYTKVLRKIPGENVTAMKGALDYVQKSAKQYGGKPAETETQPE